MDRLFSVEKLQNLRRNFFEPRPIQFTAICVAVFLFSLFVTLNDKAHVALVPDFLNESSVPAPKATLSHSFQWQKIFHDFYVYSAYYTSSLIRELHAVIMGDLLDENFWRNTHCYCFFQNETNTSASHRTRIIRARLERLPESHRQENRSMTAGRLRCLKPSSTFTAWKSVEFKCRYNQKDRTGSAVLPVPPDWDRLPPVLSFAHCGPPVYGYDRPASIIEFVEYYRLMGVSKFFWYQLQVSNRTQRVLDYYEQIGIMDLTKWSVPAAVGTRIHYFAQVALMYDCMLKTSRLFDYTVFSDLDEFFVTTKQPATFGSIMNNGNLDCIILRSSFMDPNATAFSNYTDIIDSQSHEPVLFTSTVIKRDTYVFRGEQRTKYVCRGKHIDMPRIHFPKYYRGHPTVSRPDPETEMVFHMRSGDAATKTTMLDVRGTVHRQLLEPRVNAVWKKLFSPNHR